MKENVSNNEAMLTYLEDNKVRYDQDNDTVRKELEELFKVDRHSLRAWFSRLANKNKYGGKYADRIHPFLRKKKVVEPATIPTVLVEIKTIDIDGQVAETLEKKNEELSVLVASITATELENATEHLPF